MPGSPAFQKKLKKWRDARGLSQPKAAKKLGVPLGTYRDWEQGQRAPERYKMEAMLAKVAKLKAAAGN